MNKSNVARWVAIAVLMSLLFSTPLLSEDGSIILQSTTSTANSGLYDYILPKFKADTGVTVNVVAVGTGQALKNAMNGDGDVLLVHAMHAEQEFVAKGFGVKRSDVMYNDFIIVGPPADPAGITGTSDAAAALKKIASNASLFASRGDNSGTHKKEVWLWGTAQLDPQTGSGDWYRETGSGMGATLNAAVGMGAYTMTDRATWISFRNKADYKIHVEGAEALFNQYGIILVNPLMHKNVKSAEGQIFIDWILSEKGQSVIAEYTLKGQQLFFPNSNK